MVLGGVGERDGGEAKKSMFKVLLSSGAVSFFQPRKAKGSEQVQGCSSDTESLGTAAEREPHAHCASALTKVLGGFMMLSPPPLHGISRYIRRPLIHVAMIIPGSDPGTWHNFPHSVAAVDQTTLPRSHDWSEVESANGRMPCGSGGGRGSFPEGGWNGPGGRP